jgi:predicted ATPase/class 3 adenylate cyclase
VSQGDSARSGTLTFVFTDIEGSTRLLDELGSARYAALLADHHRVCREAWAGHGGTEIETAGDAFFVAFPTAGGALGAAAEAQTGLAALGLRVRMGIHTGDVLVAETGYVGIEVHRAARIAAAAHGGQILVSETTASLTDLPLRDLGEHRFKDLRGPERVFQVSDDEFPPLRSLHRTNLPVPAAAFLGRMKELEELQALLRRPGVRRVTLTGPGGTGKTRLALQTVADCSGDFPGGTFWAPLAPLRDPELVLAAAASALELTDIGDGELLAAISMRVGKRRTLLLLDNAEHLLPRAAEIVGELTTACESLTIVVTSRERLQLSAEHVFPVQALDENDATELFVARARQLDPGFTGSAAVPELCRLLDQLPLALELAAARTAVFTPEQLVTRIGERLDLLRGARDVDPRQQTLRAAIDWSHELLNDSERRLFRQLSVFPGGCTYEEAEEVAHADPDTLQSLLDKSLVRRRSGDPEPHYWQLETIREYAGERLRDAGEEHETWHRVADAYERFARAAEAGWYRGDADYWTDRFLAELSNIRAALHWSLEHEPAKTVAIAAYLGYCWQLAGLFPELLDWLQRGEQRAGELDADLSAYSMMIAGVARAETGQPGAELLLRACLPKLLEVGRVRYHAFMIPYVAAYEAKRDPAAAEDMLLQAEQQALEFETDNNNVVLSAILHGLAQVAEQTGHDERALTLLKRGAALQLSHPSHQINAALEIAEHLLGRGDPERAEPWLRVAETIIEEHPQVATRDRPPVDIACAVAAILRNDLDDAEQRAHRAHEAGEASGRMPLVAQSLILESVLHSLRGDGDAARTAQREALRLNPDLRPTGNLRGLSDLFVEQDTVQPT